MYPKYIIISSAYNEEENIERTIKSVVKQTLTPEEWIIVNDGSTDNTAEIVQKYADCYSFIKLLNCSKENVEFGAHVGFNFQKAFKILQCKDWNYIAQLDTDIEIDNVDFYKRLISEFRNDDRLGITSGLTYVMKGSSKILTKRPYWRTGGATKFYRRECFEDIGGILPIFAWDGIDVYKAMYHGWKSRTIYDLHVNHLGKVRANNRDQTLWLAHLRGKNLYQRGFPFIFIFFRSFKYLKSSFKHQLFFLKGYFESVHKNELQFVSKEEQRFVRKIQILRIFDFFSRRQLL
jgi:glycosyltransferase involved in cell wall biosynthesis